MQKRRIISTTGLLLAAVIAVSIVIISNATFTGVRIDLTENRLFTLSDGTVSILESLQEPINLDFYFSRKVLADYPMIMNYATRVRDLLEEYAAKSGGMIELNVIEPEPFSEHEDQAVASGLEGIAVSAAGDRGYFGLVGTNSTDDQDTIPFFQVNREGALEYDVTKLIYNLDNPEKRVIGVITTLPVFGAGPRGGGQPWAIIDALREFFEVRNLGTSIDRVDGDVDVLMVIHPKELDDGTLFAVDQYLLGGGKGMLFVDPLAEADDVQPDPARPQTLPDLDSDLNVLFDTWGIEVAENKVAGDMLAAMRVQTRGARGPVETNYLPWLRLTEDNFNQDDFTTSELEVINMGTAGVITATEDSPLTLTPLLQTSTQSMRIERDLILFQRDPNVMLENFEPGQRRLTLAARLSGTVPTAYPDGPVGDQDANGADQVMEGAVNVMLVGDTDILSDRFWVRQQSFFGIDIPQSIANNGDFLINAAENLSGSSDLISLRSRGEFSRPFDVVEQIRREAEQQFREQERALQARLEETERKILELQQEGGDGALILSPEQSTEIERFRQEQIKTRKELRAVQHELQKNIERLGSQLKFINIGLMPLLIALLALGGGLYHSRRRP